jgi:hypothetical protein
MYTDRIRTDITDILFVFIFSIGFGFEHGCTWIYIRMRIASVMNTNRCVSNTERTGYGYYQIRIFFQISSKGIFIHITCVVTFKHPTSSNFN